MLYSKLPLFDVGFGTDRRLLKTIFHFNLTVLRLDSVFFFMTLLFNYILCVIMYFNSNENKTHRISKFNELH